ncbi:hypothetical protein ACFPRL_14975 [Pseudoclavibacter helvolus]
MAAGPEVLGPRVPAGGGHPEPVDEDDGGLVLVVAVHLDLCGASGWFWGLCLAVLSRTIVLSCWNHTSEIQNLSSEKRKIVLLLDTWPSEQPQAAHPLPESDFWRRHPPSSTGRGFTRLGSTAS